MLVMGPGGTNQMHLLLVAYHAGYMHVCHNIIAGDLVLFINDAVSRAAT